MSFSGVVRDHDGGRSVTELEYHEHPTAAAIVAEVAAEIAARDGVIAVAVSHRVGSAAGSATSRWPRPYRRRTAGRRSSACSDLVDEVKRRLPVWKRQVFADGTDEWVGTA